MGVVSSTTHHAPRITHHASRSKVLCRPLGRSTGPRHPFPCRTQLLANPRNSHPSHRYPPSKLELRLCSRPRPVPNPNLNAHPLADSPLSPRVPRPVGSVGLSECGPVGLARSSITASQVGGCAPAHCLLLLLLSSSPSLLLRIRYQVCISSLGGVRRLPLSYPSLACCLVVLLFLVTHCLSPRSFGTSTLFCLALSAADHPAPPAALALDIHARPDRPDTPPPRPTTDCTRQRGNRPCFAPLTTTSHA